ncbi:MAG TPA: hypothetical protein PKX38_08355 [Alphaproteobacteria bacterium]|nr:hypothetical protein [Micavibrio sp.]HQX27927.1 hypothetical protein [Alphaproteobacteria bacterium]
MSISRTILPGSSGGMVIAKSIERSVRVALCAPVLAFFLVSCGPAEPGTAARSSTSSSASKPSTGPTIAGITAPAPPGSADRPLEPGQNGAQYMPNGLPVLPARGINAEMLFAEKITDSDERFRRLENAVTDLRRELNAAMPAIVRLSAVEQDMQELLGQLQTLVEGGPASGDDFSLDSAPVPGVTADALPPRPFPEAPEEESSPPVGPEPVESLPAIAGLADTDNTAEPGPSSALPVPAEAAAPPPEPEPEDVAQGPPDTPKPEPPALAGPAVTGIRTGLQPKGITRIVLDLSGPTPHRSDLDNEEKLLLVEMPEAGWSATLNGTFADAPLLVSWTTEPLPDGKGTRLVLQLRDKVQIVSDSSLNGPARIVLDLKKSP